MVGFGVYVYMAYGVGTGSGMCMLVCMYVAVWQMKTLGDLFGEEGVLLCRSLLVEEQVQAVAFRPCAYAATIYMREGESAGSKIPSRIHARAPRGQAVWFDNWQGETGILIMAPLQGRVRKWRRSTGCGAVGDCRRRGCAEALGIGVGRLRKEGRLAGRGRVRMKARRWARCGDAECEMRGFGGSKILREYYFPDGIVSWGTQELESCYRR